MTQHPLPFASPSPERPEENGVRAETSRPALLVPDRATLEPPGASSSPLPKALSFEPPLCQDSSAPDAPHDRGEASPAADERWSAARLTEEVAAGREEGVRRRGRPRLPPEMRRLRQVLRAVASSALAADRAWFERLSEAEQTEVKDALTRASAWCIGLHTASLPRNGAGARPGDP